MVYKLKSNASILLPTLLCLDFHKPLPHPEVQFSSLPYHFWTSACFSAASKSIPPHFSAPFGLSPCLTPLSSPFRHFSSFCSDFCTLSHLFKVQSATFPRSVWTFAHCLTSSKSIPPLFLVLFGLLHTVSPLQSPFRHFSSLRLDFRTLSLCFKVQSATFPRSVWTFAHCPTASKSNPPHLYQNRKRCSTVLLYLQVILTGF